MKRRGLIIRNRKGESRFLPKSKKGMDILHGAVIFIVLNLIFFSVMFFFIARAGSQATIVEQKYAKRIALIIDQAKPGTNISLDLQEVYFLADKNNINRLDTIKIDNEKKEILVRVDVGPGYSYRFFSDDVILWGLKRKAMKLEMEVKKNVV